MGEQGSDRQGRRGALIDRAEEAATGVARVGYGLLGIPLRLLPKQSRTHMYNAIRELSYGFAGLPRDFAEIVEGEIERWAGADKPKAGFVPLTVEIAAEEPVAAEPTLTLGAAPEAPPAPVAPEAPVAVAVELAPPELPVVELVPPELPVVELVPPPAAPELPAVASGVTGVEIAHIEYDPPGRDLDGEYVLIWNTSDTSVALTGWVLTDGDAKHTYTFPPFTLDPGAKLKLWTKRGANDAGNLYWGNARAIWNNDGDTGTLRDASGATISVYSYTGK
jgi:hypothetical protein